MLRICLQACLDAAGRMRLHQALHPSSTLPADPATSSLHLRGCWAGREGLLLVLQGQSLPKPQADFDLCIPGPHFL